jgi:hypothetical protein
MSQSLEDTSNGNSREFQEVIGAIAKITSCSPEEIKPHLAAFINRLSQTKKDDLAENSFYTTSTHEEWLAEFHDWVNSHKGKDIPVLSDEAMSRESMYPDR